MTLRRLPPERASLNASAKRSSAAAQPSWLSGRALIASRQCRRRSAFRAQLGHCASRLRAASRHLEGCRRWLRGVMSQTGRISAMQFPQCDPHTASSRRLRFAPPAMHWANMRFFLRAGATLLTATRKGAPRANIPAQTENLSEKNVTDR